jgi:hypothetical protein
MCLTYIVFKLTILKAGHGAGMGYMRNRYKIFVGKLKGRVQLEDIKVDRRLILKRILEKWGGKLWTGYVLDVPL